MKPQVSQAVHYVRHAGGPCEAAVITSVGLPPGALAPHFPGITDPVSLTPLPGAVNIGPVGYDEARGGGTWHRPEQED